MQSLWADTCGLCSAHTLRIQFMSFYGCTQWQPARASATAACAVSLYGCMSHLLFPQLLCFSFCISLFLLVLFLAKKSYAHNACPINCFQEYFVLSTNGRVLWLHNEICVCVFNISICCSEYITRWINKNQYIYTTIKLKNNDQNNEFF